MAVAEEAVHEKAEVVRVVDAIWVYKPLHLDDAALQVLDEGQGLLQGIGQTLILLEILFHFRSNDELQILARQRVFLDELHPLSLEGQQPFGPGKRVNIR